MTYVRRFSTDKRAIRQANIAKSGTTHVSERTAIGQRKADHLAINIERDVSSETVTSGFEHYRFMHQALPELDLPAVAVRTSFLGHSLEAPILISSMTGGVERGWEINRRLARVAQALGCAMGVGSQRAGLEHAANARFYSVRDVAPDILLFANLGAIQLNNGYGVDECRRAVEMIDADALILHLNPLQEAIQSDGNQNFSGLVPKIGQLCQALDRPVVVKEIGCGISTEAACRLANVGVAAIDVAGTGGTSWSKVEHFRATSWIRQRLGATFAEWGIPTATSLLMCRSGAPDLPLIASGGLVSGLDAAKAIALGADLAGFAGPLLRAAAISEQVAYDLMSALIEELRLAMFCTGSATLADLRTTKLLTPDDGTMSQRTSPLPTFTPKTRVEGELSLVAADRLAESRMTSKGAS